MPDTACPITYQLKVHLIDISPMIWRRCLVSGDRKAVNRRLQQYVEGDRKWLFAEVIAEYSGKMNFYINAVNDLLRRANDKPTIGIILCKSKNKAITEYSLRQTKAPLAIASI